MSEQTKAQAFERLERVVYERREFHPVGDTEAEMAECMAWVRALGHEAKSLEPEGFRYRSVYATPTYDGSMTSQWQWAEPGQWLMHMAGEKQEPELDSPHGEGPVGEDGGLSWGLSTGWHRVSKATR